jgi:hypothetical protein
MNEMVLEQLRRDQAQRYAADHLSALPDSAAPTAKAPKGFDSMPNSMAPTARGPAGPASSDKGIQSSSIFSGMSAGTRTQVSPVLSVPELEAAVARAEPPSSKRASAPPSAKM